MAVPLVVSQMAPLRHSLHGVGVVWIRPSQPWRTRVRDVRTNLRPAPRRPPLSELLVGLFLLVPDF